MRSRPLARSRKKVGGGSCSGRNPEGDGLVKYRQVSLGLGHALEAALVSCSARIIATAAAARAKRISCRSLRSAPHWSFPEMKEAFGWNCDEFIYYGGYPGSAPLIEDSQRWRQYIVDSLVETTVSRDILLLTRVDKPSLLRRLFRLGCEYSGQVLSYQKMLGQLQEAGNTVTLAHYLELLGGAGMIAGISKYSKGQVRQRGSSPKLQVLNTALMTTQFRTVV